MKLSKQEKKEMIEDGKSRLRRDRFRAMGQPHASSFEEYLAALDDIQTLRPAPKPAVPAKYTNIRL
jgi:hypothetical protein